MSGVDGVRRAPVAPRPRMTVDHKPLCRCRGIERRDPCVKRATQEDGLCDPCREVFCEDA